MGNKIDVNSNIIWFRNVDLPKNKDFEVFYRNKMSEYCYYHSKTVTDADNNTIDKGLKRFLRSITNESNNIQTSFIADCKTESGFDLTEKMFIENELHKIEEKYNKFKYECNFDIRVRAENYIDFLKSKLEVLDKKPQQPTNNRDTDTTQTKQIIIPENILNELEKTTCNNGKCFIECATERPLKWIQNKQLLRELLTHDKIKGILTIAEIERQAPSIFIDNNNNKLNLAKNKKVPSTDSDNLSKILATL